MINFKPVVEANRFAIGVSGLPEFDCAQITLAESVSLESVHGKKPIRMSKSEQAGEGMTMTMAANQFVTNHLVLAGKSGIYAATVSALRTSMSYGHSAGRGFDSPRLHQIALGWYALSRTLSSDDPPGLSGRMLHRCKESREQYCGADLDSTGEFDGRKLVPGMSTPLTVHQTKNAKSILVKAISFVKSLFTMPEFGMAQPSLA